MSYQYRRLAERLRIVLSDAAGQRGKLDRDELADHIAGQEHAAFLYRYRDQDGAVRDGYVTGRTIARYLVFLEEDLKLLDENQVPTATDWDDDVFVEQAKSRLVGAGLGVKAISDKAENVLRMGEGVLPTPDYLFTELADGTLSRRQFKWLIGLYSLGDTALFAYLQRQLVLPRRYANR